MSAPSWLAQAIGSCEARALDDATDRAKVITAIVDALPAKAIAVRIAESARAVLRQRGVRDDKGDIARELANNAAQQVLFLLGVGE